MTAASHLNILPTPPLASKGQRMLRGYSQAHRQLMLALVALALAARILVPAGWMPSESGGRSTITLCTGQGMVEAWIDADGKIHKSAPEKGGKASGTCMFAALGLAVVAAVAGFFVAALFDRRHIPGFSYNLLVLGRGLAAPPPPARGPPLLI